MSNPFDQFASEFQAALPPGAPGAQPPAPQGGPPPPYGAPPPPGQPPMNGMNGAPMYAQPPPQQGGYGAPTPFGSPQQPPPQQQQPAYGSSPFSMNGGGMPPGQAPMPTGPPPGAGDPFGGYGQPPPSGPPPGPPPGQAPPEPVASAPAGNPFGSAPPVESQGSGGDQYYGEPAPPPPPEPQQTPSGGGSVYGGGDPWGSPGGNQPPPQGAPPGQPQYGAPPEQYGAPPPQYGAPPPQYGAPPPPQQQYGAPPEQYGAPPPQQQGAPDPSQGALVPAQQQSNPYAQYGQPPPPPGAYGQPPPNPYAQQNPYGQQQQQPMYQQQAPPPPPVAVDPFSVFESQQSQASSEPAPPAPGPPQQAPGMSTAMVSAPAAGDEDFWGSFGNQPAPDNTAVVPVERPVRVSEAKQGDDSNNNGLPPGGEWYDARIFTPTLGVMFFKPQELTDSLFLNTEREVVDALGDRPVVAFIVEGSSARSAGVELGHVLLKVNGVDVKSPKEASRLIKEGPRPLPLLFYVPNTDVVVAEGEHMVKYDSRETTAPNSAKDWKPKYVVIGGIIAQPWMMNMYRSKSEYDIAVIETQARRPVSVKVKQFSMQGTRIQNDWQGPQMVKYKNKLHPWKYIVVLPVARNPIKISSPNLAQLKPVHEGIRRVLLAQQRDRGSKAQTAAVRQNDQGQGGHQQQGGGGNGYDQDGYRAQQAQQQQQQQAQQQQQDDNYRQQQQAQQQHQAQQQYNQQQQQQGYAQQQGSQRY